MILLASLAGSAAATVSSSKVDEQELFYTEGTAELKAARVFIGKYSLPRAQVRIQNQKQHV
jgi:hypothetical protein